MDKSSKALLALAIGDAFGAGYEFLYETRQEFEENFIFKYLGREGIPAGMYTDDTQMSLAIAELMRSDKEFSKANLAQAFVDAYKRDPIEGYSSGMQALLESSTDGKDFLLKINPTGTTNGAAMRAVPIGLQADEKKVIEYAIINAKVTHDTPKAIASSVGIALMAYMAYRGIEQVPVEYLYTHLRRIDPETARFIVNPQFPDTGIPCDAMMTLGAISHLLRSYEKPTEILRQSIFMGGDVDTIAAVALGIKMINHSFSELPEFLVSKLTNHKYGRDYILSL